VKLTTTLEEVVLTKKRGRTTAWSPREREEKLKNLKQRENKQGQEKESGTRKKKMRKKKKGGPGDVLRKSNEYRYRRRVSQRKESLGISTLLIRREGQSELQKLHVVTPEAISRKRMVG